MSIQKILQNLQNKFGVSEGKLADELRVSPRTINRWTKGHHNPSYANSKMIEKIYHETKNL